MHPISFSQAINLLKQNPDEYNTSTALRNLVNQVDIYSPGKITILYSGSYATNDGNLSANTIVQEMYKNGDDIRIINNTAVAQLISSDEFVQAAGKALGYTNSFEIDVAYKDLSSEFNATFYDAENGLWADASRRFAAETVGEVRTLTANTRLHTQIR